jgi:hypothetical protein
VVIWYIFPRFGILYQEKSGNPVPDTTNGSQSKASSVCMLFREKTFVRQNGNQFNDNLCQTMKQKIDCLGKKKKTGT